MLYHAYALCFLRNLQTYTLPWFSLPATGFDVRSFIDNNVAMVCFKLVLRKEKKNTLIVSAADIKLRMLISIVHCHCSLLLNSKKAAFLLLPSTSII